MPTGVIRLNEGWTLNSGQHFNEPPVVTLPVPPPVHRKRGAKIMNQDYIPPKRNDRYRFYKNISSNVVGEAVKFNAAAGDATAVKAIADNIIAKMEATDTASDALDAARLLENGAETAGLPQLRAKFRNWKTLPGWAASGSEGVLELAGPSTTFDPNSYQTTLTATLVPGGVKLTFPKKGVEGVALYMRIVGTTNWVKIGSANHSPFTDHTPLAHAGVPETREYMARGLVNDAEIGTDSSAVSVTFAG
jgi:hypothetical protein